MRSTFFGLDTALRALQAQQQAIDVTSHNVANANTEGFSRQAVEFETTSPYTVPAFNRNLAAGQVGTGTQVTMIKRIRDAFLDYQVRQELQSLGNWQSQSDVLQQIEVVFNEPSDSGLNSLLDRFWSAWQELTNNPQDVAVRANLVEVAGNLAVTMNRDYQQLDKIKRDVDDQIRIKVADINSLAQQLADLNAQIAAVQVTGDQANDLKDQRDLLLDRLAKMTRISYTEAANGQLSIFVQGQPLVERDRANTIVVSNDANGYAQLTWSSDNSPVVFDGGELKGLIDMRDVGVTSRINDLQQVASLLITSVNDLHKTGFGLDDVTGRNFFSGTGANDIAVDADIQSDVRHVAAGAAADAPGDGSVALAIARLQHLSGTNSVSGLFKELIARLGVDARGAATMVTNEDLLVQHLDRRRESMAGVSLDEESTNLIRYQHAYQAAARVITTVDDMLDTIINGMGRVGR